MEIGNSNIKINNSNNNNNDHQFNELFWKVFHNELIFKTIIKYIDNNSFQFSSYEKCYIGNRIKWSNIKSLQWMVENSQYSLLKDKLQSNQYIHINQFGIFKFFQDCKDEQIIDLLYKNHKVQLEMVDLLQVVSKFQNFIALNYFLNSNSNNNDGASVLVSVSPSLQPLPQQSCILSPPQSKLFPKLSVFSSSLEYIIKHSTAKVLDLVINHLINLKQQNKQPIIIEQLEDIRHKTLQLAFSNKVDQEQMVQYILDNNYFSIILDNNNIDINNDTSNNNESNLPSSPSSTSSQQSPTTSTTSTISTSSTTSTELFIDDDQKQKLNNNNIITNNRLNELIDFNNFINFNNIIVKNTILELSPRIVQRSDLREFIETILKTFKDISTFEELLYYIRVLFKLCHPKFNDVPADIQKEINNYQQLKSKSKQDEELIIRNIKYYICKELEVPQLSIEFFLDYNDINVFSGLELISHIIEFSFSSKSLNILIQRLKQHYIQKQEQQLNNNNSNSNDFKLPIIHQSNSYLKDLITNTYNSLHYIENNGIFEKDNILEFFKNYLNQKFIRLNIDYPSILINCSVETISELMNLKGFSIESLVILDIKFQDFEKFKWYFENIIKVFVEPDKVELFANFPSFSNRDQFQYILDNTAFFQKRIESASFPNLFNFPKQSVNIEYIVRTEFSLSKKNIRVRRPSFYQHFVSSLLNCDIESLSGIESLFSRNFIKDTQFKNELEQPFGTFKNQPFDKVKKLFDYLNNSCYRVLNLVSSGNNCMFFECVRALLESTSDFTSDQLLNQIYINYDNNPKQSFKLFIYFLMNSNFKVAYHILDRIFVFPNDFNRAALVEIQNQILFGSGDGSSPFDVFDSKDLCIKKSNIPFSQVYSVLILMLNKIPHYYFNTLWFAIHHVYNSLLVSKNVTLELLEVVHHFLSQNNLNIQIQFYQLFYYLHIKSPLLSNYIMSKPYYFERSGQDLSNDHIISVGGGYSFQFILDSSIDKLFDKLIFSISNNYFKNNNLSNIVNYLTKSNNSNRSINNSGGSGKNRIRISNNSNNSGGGGSGSLSNSNSCNNFIIDDYSTGKVISYKYNSGPNNEDYQIMDTIDSITGDTQQSTSLFNQQDIEMNCYSEGKGGNNIRDSYNYNNSYDEDCFYDEEEDEEEDYYGDEGDYNTNNTNNQFINSHQQHQQQNQHQQHQQQNHYQYYQEEINLSRNLSLFLDVEYFLKLNRLDFVFYIFSNEYNRFKQMFSSNYGCNFKFIRKLLTTIQSIKSLRDLLQLNIFSISTLLEESIHLNRLDLVSYICEKYNNNNIDSSSVSINRFYWIFEKNYLDIAKYLFENHISLLGLYERDTLRISKSKTIKLSKTFNFQDNQGNQQQINLYDSPDFYNLAYSKNYVQMCELIFKHYPLHIQFKQEEELSSSF